MPENVLIATVGHHPGVVTAMVKVLRETAQIRVDTLHVLHPQGSGKYIGREGFRLIAEHLAGTCRIISEPLPFADPYTTQTSMAFLQSLAGLLERYRDGERYHVYLSLAGGRKNTSALMALATQFFPAVRGLYHLIDRLEESRHPSFPSVKDMELYLTEDEVRAALDPDVEDLELVPIPYPGAFAGAAKLWEIVKTGGALHRAPEFGAFFAQVAGRRQAPARLRVWLSEQAGQDYRRLGSEQRARFLGYARRMQHPDHLEAKAGGPRGWDTDCQVYPEHQARVNLRLFYRWDRPAQEVTICRAMLHRAYERQGTLLSADHPRAIPISALEQEVSLLVPLGKAPMVATQTYTLLRESETEGRPNVPLVAVLFPERHRAIGNGVRLLKRQFERQGIEFIPFSIRGLKDVDSGPACETYLGALLDAIAALRQKHPDRPIALSLSGGRKGMSALSLFAAQHAGIERVYHTLITDPDLEKRVEEEGRVRALEALPTDDDRARRLFLEAYGREHFELFAVPVIPLEEAGGP